MNNQTVSRGRLFGAILATAVSTVVLMRYNDYHIFWDEVSAPRFVIAALLGIACVWLSLIARKNRFKQPFALPEDAVKPRFGLQSGLIALALIVLYVVALRILQPFRGMELQHYLFVAIMFVVVVVIFMVAAYANLSYRTRRIARREPWREDRTEELPAIRA